MGSILPTCPIPLREPLDAPKPQIVPGISKLGPRVSKPNNQPRPLGHQPNQRIGRGVAKEPPQKLEHEKD